MPNATTTPRDLPAHAAGAPARFGASARLPFLATIRQFPNAAALATYLGTLPPPDWPGNGPIGSVAHNTYRPTVAQWAGKKSMDGMITTYTGKGWDRGPHFYFAVGAPNKAHDGIWLMTPPTVPGVHAGDCNEDRFGCELVGDFQNAPPPQALQQLFLDGLTVLHRWARIGPNLNAHRDCMPGRTCPGDSMYAIMPQLRAQLTLRLAAPPPLPAGPDWATLWGPVAPPDQVSWSWAVPELWKVHHARLGPCIASALYGAGIVVQAFAGGDIRGILSGNQTTYEVCFR